MKLKYALLAVLIVVLILLVYFLAGGSTAKVPKSSKLSQSFCLNAAQNSLSINTAIDGGISCFRADISLNGSEESFVANESGSGADYLGILDYRTVGAQPSRNGCVSGCNWTLGQWNASVSNAIAAYPEIRTWEIWNQPLDEEFASGYENGSALDYFNMIRNAYAIIKSSEPNATIVCFGGAEVYPIQSVQIEYQFYSQVWSYGASRYCDAISLHAYTALYYDFSQNVSGQATLEQEYNFTLNLYENLTGKPIWITETGIPSNNWTAGVSLSEQRQASFLVQDFDFFASHPFVKRMYWFHLVGYAGSADYGLLNATTMAPKPSWYSFLGFVQNSTNQDR